MEISQFFKQSNTKGKPTHIIIFIILTIFLTIAAFISGKIRDGRTPINSDAAGYYCYLPAIFIYGDIHCGFLKQGSELANHYQQEYGYPPEIWFLNNTEKGEITKYSCGTALCELPLFLCACGLSKIIGTECDGYSMIFKLMFILSNLIFSILGIYLLYKNLKNHVHNHVAATTAAVIGLCTNLFYYTTTWIGSAHIYNFFFATALLFQWHKFLESPTTKSLILSALAIGMMVLIRPTDCVFGVFVLLYTVMSGKLPTILKYLKDNIITAIIAVVAFTIPLAIQMVIWKISTGHFIYYSYQDEGFDFMHPHIIDGLFSFKKGWLVYTPVMLLAFVGMAFCQKKYNIPLITTLVIHCYIVFSWWCWWYGGSFGCRVMIVMYPILALPMAKLLERAKTKWAMIAAGLVLAFFMFWNVLQSYQVQKGILHYEDTNWQIYKESLFKIK